MLITSAIALATLLQAAAPAPSTQAIDSFVQTQLARRQVPGLSLAIIDGGRIVYAKGYGVTSLSGSEPVTPETLFLAGSVSKSVAAMGALRLVEQGKLTLDGDVNDLLRTWKVPANDYTRVEKVTLRRLTSHTAGLTVHGFPGYARTVAVPTTPQILDGVAPANTAPVRVNFVPGERWRYSGGGYTVMQLLMEDVTGVPFAAWMREQVLLPLGMTSSTFENPLPPTLVSRAAAGVYGDRSPVEGDWHVYPEMAAAGLWTTASDLALFAIGVQQANAGSSNPVISQDMTRLMLTEVKNRDGLGVFLDGDGESLRFYHGGRDEGFDTYMGAFATGGRGLVIMINANDNSGLMRRILNFVARQYAWPGQEPQFPVKPVRMPASTLAAIAGRYEAGNNSMLALRLDKGQIVSIADGLPDRVWVPTGPLTLTSDDGERQFTFVREGSGRVVGFTRPVNGTTATAPRIGPLLDAPAARPDPNPARTAMADSALRALAAGGTAVTNAASLVEGTKTSLGTDPVRALAGYTGITYLLEEDVRGRGIERHGSQIARVLHYRLNTPARDPYVLVYLNEAGLVADYDVVAE